MNKILNKIKNFFKENNKKTLFVYIFLRILVIICLIRELMNQDYENVLFCILSLCMFTVPFIIEKKFKIEFPSILEIIVLVFIFAAEILGEINNFYGTIPFWDSALHTINGFLCASIGFSLIYLLNEKTNLINLSPIFVALVSFCFSMTVGVAWELFEYSIDINFQKDMQKDEYVNVINTVSLDPKEDNNVISIKNIDYIILYDKNDKEITKIDNYLDIGLHDTMSDLIVNFVGALVFSIFGYLYIINNEKYKFAGKLMTRKKKVMNDGKNN